MIEKKEPARPTADEVLRRMLATPPNPKAAPIKLPKKQRPPEGGQNTQKNQ
jgi:hypothetical protein